MQRSRFREAEGIHVECGPFKRIFIHCLECLSVIPALNPNLDL